MKILFASDALLDIISKSSYSEDACKLIDYCGQDLIKGYFSAIDIVYMSNVISTNLLRRVIEVISQRLTLINTRTSDIKRACRNSNFDAGVYECIAYREKIDYIVSRDIDKYRCTIEVLTPKQLVKLIENGKTIN